MATTTRGHRAERTGGHGAPGTNLVDHVRAALDRDAVGAREQGTGEGAPGSAGAWDVRSDDFWCTVRPPGHAARAQGWKIHVSARTGDAPHVLGRVCDVLLPRRVAFKFAGDLERLRMLNSREADRASAGKFITVYPDDDEQFMELVDALDEVTRELTGPGILSDRPCRPGSVVHYRYGGFGRRAVLGNDGGYRAVLTDPDGSAVDDAREAWFTPPPWAPDPLVRRARSAPSAASASAPRRAGVLIGGRFAVTSALRHSAKGGVFLGRDTTDDTEVVVKQARAHIEVDRSGRDACAALRHEAVLMRRLEHTGVTPRHVALLEEAETIFLAQERIPGEPLRAWAVRHAADPDVPWARARPLVEGLIRLVRTVHGEGLVIRDLSPTNVLVGPDGALRLVDLELAAEIGAPAGAAGTPGYRAPEQRPAVDGSHRAHPSADLYSLGGLFFLLATGADPALPEDVGTTRDTVERLGAWLESAARHGETARRLAPAIRGLWHEDPTRRWSTERVSAFVTGPAGGGGGGADPVDDVRSGSGGGSLDEPRGGARGGSAAGASGESGDGTATEASGGAGNGSPARSVGASGDLAGGRSGRVVSAGPPGDGPRRETGHAVGASGDLVDGRSGRGSAGRSGQGPRRESGLVDGAADGRTGCAARQDVPDGPRPHPDTEGDKVPPHPQPPEDDVLLRDGLAHLVATMTPGRVDRLWPMTAGAAAMDPCGVQYGAAGVLGVLARAAHTTTLEPRLRYTLHRAVEDGAAWLRDRAAAEPVVLPGLHFGRSGTAWALHDAATLLGDAELAAGAADLALRVPIAWPNPDVCHGAAGAGLLQVRMWRATGDERFRRRVVACADTLLGAARQTGDLTLWPVPRDFDSRLAGAAHLGFAHGVAGVGAFLLEAALTTGREGYLDGARAAARTLARTVRVDGDTAWWPQGPGDPDGVRLAYWCSGSAGVGTFLIRLWRADHDPLHRDLAERAGAAVHRARWHSGTTACHGLAGNGEFLLDLAETLGDPIHRARAAELADQLRVRTAIVDGLRVPADETATGVSASYGTGTAGVLGFLLRLGHGGARLWLDGEEA
ncbi:class III lanthionine synthetase LanKC N-terminal domain-containing protein [Embleya hyalina]|uniref:non-specific serine/threonine protein kinase n=1 Tax=Embleya hyalina TaxID=516124 RepID=A0A401YZE2_9ACTN|nr:lanthionine synthetase LanC family protein [Embleya hyalina]GCD99930.1 serine/threonine protein kinase [Embleya hyalina]